MSTYDDTNVLDTGYGMAVHIDRTSPSAYRLSSECEAATVLSLNGQEIGAMYQAVNDDTLVIRLFEEQNGHVLPRSAKDYPDRASQDITLLTVFRL